MTMWSEDGFTPDDDGLSGSRMFNDYSGGLGPEPMRYGDVTGRLYDDIGRGLPVRPPALWETV